MTKYFSGFQNTKKWDIASNMCHMAQNMVKGTVPPKEGW